jgi:polysaccharide biosynthesis transport protein
VTSSKFHPKVVDRLNEASSSYPYNYRPDQSYHSEDGSLIDVGSLLSSLWRGKWLIIISAAIFSILAVLYVLRLDPVYRASATVMFGIQKANVMEFEDLLAAQDIDADRLENEVQILRSTSLLTRVVEELNLDDDPEFNPALEESGQQASNGGLASGFPPLAWAKSLISSLTSDNSLEIALSPEEAERQKVLAAVETMKSNLLLKPVPVSTVIEVSFDSYSPEVSARVVNEITEQYIVDQLQVKLDTANAATRWLTTRVEELRQKVQASEEAVETLRASLLNDNGQGLEITQQQLADLNAALASARGQAASAEARFLRLTEAVNAGRDLSSESDLIREYRDEEGNLLARRNTLTANHPAVPQINAQVEDLRERIRNEAGRIIASAEIELKTAGTNVQELEQGVRDLESRTRVQSVDEIRIRQLEREAQASRLMYENLLVRLNETSEQEDLQSADARILSPAEIPIQPESDKVLPIILSVGFLGAFVGAGLAFLRDNLNNTFRSPRQVEEITGECVLAILPALQQRFRNRDLIRYLLRKPNSSLAEAVRNLRTSVLLPGPDSHNPPKVVMFTSSLPGEGKSTTAMLTAITSRQMGKSTIIVDCDLRLSSFDQFLNARDDEPGILSVLDGSATLEEALYEDPLTGLHVLMVRQGERKIKSDKNAADMLASKKFCELIGYLSQIYDIVILDTPPALVVTDARIISSLADKVAYVVRWNRTPRDAVIEGLKELRSVDAPISGTVLSMVNEAKASRTRVDGYVYYRGKHSSYYTN